MPLSNKLFANHFRSSEQQKLQLAEMVSSLVSMPLSVKVLTASKVACSPCSFYFDLLLVWIIF